MQAPALQKLLRSWRSHNCSYASPAFLASGRFNHRVLFSLLTTVSGCILIIRICKLSVNMSDALYQSMRISHDRRSWSWVLGRIPNKRNQCIVLQLHCLPVCKCRTFALLATSLSTCFDNITGLWYHSYCRTRMRTSYPFTSAVLPSCRGFFMQLKTPEEWGSLQGRRSYSAWCLDENIQESIRKL